MQPGCDPKAKFESPSTAGFMQLRSGSAQLSFDCCLANRGCSIAHRSSSQRWSFAMTEIQSKSAFLYREVRRALRSGRYVPGERIDPATLAEAFHASPTPVRFRSEEHTSELQSRENLVCRLLLETKKENNK